MQWGRMEGRKNGREKLSRDLESRYLEIPPTEGFKAP